MNTKQTDHKRFVMITPAFNEQEYLGQTIECVLQLTCLPDIWIIVDDDSRDKTASIIQEYAFNRSWIRYYRRRKIPGQSYYGSNVYAIMEGYEQIRDESFEYLAILDADITLPSNYYERLFAEFERDGKLGVVSGIYQEMIRGRLVNVLNDRRSTPKALQVFRRACFDEIGGYLPLKNGGEDTCSCIMARMKGWKSWSFPDLKAIHRKPSGMGHTRSVIQARFRMGLNEYGLGTHPLFLLLKSIRRCFLERPFLLSGLARIAGYAKGWIRREERQIPPEVTAFVRAEQVKRIFRWNKFPKENTIESRNYG